MTGGFTVHHNYMDMPTFGNAINEVKLSQG
jgi:hypothetical protein